MLSILPNRITTSAEIYINPNGQGSSPDFLFADYPLDASIQLKIPLNLIANDLHLRDTTNFDFEQNNDYEIDKIFVQVENGFPIDCRINMILLDQNQTIIDTIFKNQEISSGFTSNNLVTESSISLLESDLMVQNNTKKIIFDVIFNTEDINDYVSIYNDYTIDFSLSAKLKARIN